MKRTLVLVTTIILLAASPAPAGWFNNNEEKLLMQAQEQLAQERQNTGTWQIISSVLALGCVTLLLLGTALGSKVRQKEASEPVTLGSNEQTGE